MRPLRQVRWRWKQPRWQFISQGMRAFSILMGDCSWATSSSLGTAGRVNEEVTLPPEVDERELGEGMPGLPEEWLWLAEFMLECEVKLWWRVEEESGWW